MFSKCPTTVVCPQLHTLIITYYNIIDSCRPILLRKLIAETWALNNLCEIHDEKFQPIIIIISCRISGAPLTMGGHSWGTKLAIM